ncbi:MAG: D-alanyl-D-alanine carboxypeptidase [Clostridia bacterium]|nr:D-alanyl-D-alanine carboxypeptidase [Clostridia bacterium]
MKYILSSTALLLVLPLLIFSLMGDFIAYTAPADSIAQPTLQETQAPHIYPAPTLSLSAKHAVLITANGDVVYAKNAYEKAEMASTTKIMTALLTAEYLEKHSYAVTTTVTSRAQGVEGSSVYLEEGETVRVLDLLYALLLASANDAAVALAEAVGGTVQDFVALMNEKSRSLALDNTNFQNPHGLPSEEHYTTAYSLARLMAYAMKNPLFARVSATTRYTMQTDRATRHIVNHNRLLTSYDGTLGGKTGFTKRAGRCLVTAAEREGVRLFAVTLSAPDDWNDHKTLFDYGFSAIEAVTVPAERYVLSVINGKSEADEKADLVAVSDPIVLMLPKTRGKLTLSRELPRFVYAPIAKGDPVGRIVVLLDGTPIAETPLYAEAAKEAQEKPSIWERLFS